VSNSNFGGLKGHVLGFCGFGQGRIRTERERAEEGDDVLIMFNLVDDDMVCSIIFVVV